MHKAIATLALLIIPFTISGNELTPKQYSIEDFFSTPPRSLYRLSDDGQTLAFMQPVSIDGGPLRQNIYIQSIKNGAPTGTATKLTHESARDIQDFHWKGSNTILYQKDFGGNENFHVVAVNIHNGEIKDLTPFVGVRAVVENDLPRDPEHVLIRHNQRSPSVFDVYRANVHTGTLSLVAENPGNIADWQTDHLGQVRAAVTTDGLNSSLLFRENETTPFRTLITTDYRTQVTPIFFSGNNRKIYALSNRGRDNIALVLIDPEHPDKEELIFSPKDVDVDKALYSEKLGTLILAIYQTDKPHIHVFDSRVNSLITEVASKLDGYSFAITDTNDGETTFIVSAYNDRTPGSIYLYHLPSKKLEKLADVNPAISENDMAMVQPISYVSRDGLIIHGYLTLPVGQMPKHLPCIINPHGGPWQRDSWGYNPEVQFLANRGFCVLQMNFRGSTGYGRRFWEAGFGQWGLKMQDDITDGVHWLIAQGIADPKRIGIYGASYGGYAALAGVTFTPSLYAAAVDYVGISNLLTFMDSIPPYWKPYLARMKVMIGDPELDRARMASTSPALHALRIKAPLLIAQGANDPRVNKNESDQMVDALRRRGVYVQYLVKENEGHGFSNEENRIEFYKAAESFLIKNLIDLPSEIIDDD